MKYDYDTHKYRLTADAVLNLAAIDLNAELGTELKARAFLIEQTNEIYTYIYGLRANLGDKYSAPKSLVEYMIFKDNNNETEILRDALIEQVNYSIQSSTDRMVNEATVEGIVLTTAQRLDLMIAPMAKSILAQNVIGRKITPSFRIAPEDYRAGY